MAKNRSSAGTGSSGARSGGKSGTTSGVSTARLHQKSGSSNAFGGYTKVAKTDGTFRMRKSGK